MIRLNNRDYEWHEGLTIDELMKENNFTYSRIIVSINHRLILEEDYTSTLINDGDDVKALHLLAGG
jgi:sulfur carrier protein